MAHKTTKKGDLDSRFQSLDPGIRNWVELLASEGVETFESCQGGVGHCSPEPFIRFHGTHGEGMRALGVALRARLPVVELRRQWVVVDFEACGPYWAMVFAHADH